LILDWTYWRNYGVETLKERLALQPNTKKAKNVILFIGDGMGVATHTAARIYKGLIFLKNFLTQCVHF
jgi:alkaline phosphatase